jgi:Ca2+-binding RTX toxin-like protein
VGSNGIDLLLGGDDNDFIDGQQGNDVVFMGAGDDTFQWDPGDGSDVVEGQDDFDTLRFNGSNGDEIFELSANGQRVLFTRNLGNIVMDMDDVEQVDLRALGGSDTATMNDLAGTAVVEFLVDLANPPGSGTGDAKADNVILTGTGADDVILVSGAPGLVDVVGLACSVFILGSEPAHDRLTINSLAGDDAVEASALQANAIGLTADGGVDNDVLVGSDGPDVLLGGEGDDVLLGGPGLDILDGGPGDNVVIQG